MMLRESSQKKVLNKMLCGKADDHMVGVVGKIRNQKHQ